MRYCLNLLVQCDRHNVAVAGIICALNQNCFRFHGMVSGQLLHVKYNFQALVYIV